MKEIIASSNDAGQRVDKFLQKMLPALPGTLMYRYIRIKRIKLNGKRCTGSDCLAVGDRLELYINDEFFTEKKSFVEDFLSAGNHLDILYEDQNIILIDKRPGLVVHEDESGGADTLVNRLKRYLFEKGEYDPQKEQSFTPALCNRIDRNTGGIVVAAKNAATLRVVNELIKQRLVEKYYLCVVHGRPVPDSATLRCYIKKDAERNIVTVYDKPVSGGLNAITKYRVLEERGRFSLLEIELMTGRTHQIRAQMAHIGHPLLGDAKYGVNQENKGTGYKHQALYAFKLIFKKSELAGHLQYLCGKEFETENIWFMEDFSSGKIV